MREGSLDAVHPYMEQPAGHLRDLDGIPDSTDPYPMRTDEGSGLAPALPADASAGLYDITDAGTVYNPYTGRVKKDTSASGAVSLYAYDKDGNMSACLTRADGKAYLATASYTSEGYREHAVFNGLAYDFTYDSLGNVLQVMEGGSALATYTYGYEYEEGQGGGQELSGSHLATVSYPGGGTISYAYTQASILVPEEDEEGDVTYASRTVWLPASVQTDGGQAGTYTYNTFGNLSSYTDGCDGTSYTYAYDSSQALTGISGSNGFSWEGTGSESGSAGDGDLSVAGQDTFTLGTEEMTSSYTTSQTDGGEGSRTVTTLITGNQLTEYTGPDGQSQVRIGSAAGWDTVETASGDTVISYLSGESLSYSYGADGNTASVMSLAGGTQSPERSYIYDGMGQVIRADDAASGTTSAVTYDACGNITSRTDYAYTTGSLPSSGGTAHTYTYGDSAWRDRLTAYDGQAITYDAAGNPLAYRGGSTLTWSAGRRLSSHETAAFRSEYAYNDTGIRTGKSVTDKASGAVTATEYYLSDGDIIAEERTSGGVSETIWYAYSGCGSLAGFIYGGEDYYYRKNLEGDITGIYDDAGNLKVTYTYDMWGKQTGVTDTTGTGLADINPFRYRGYYYDSETGYYYLNSRYYDPETGRFLNADDPAYIGDSGIGGNLYAYCGNNAVNDSDPGGSISFQQVVDIVLGALGLVCGYLSLAKVKRMGLFSSIVSGIVIILAIRHYIKDCNKKNLSKSTKRIYRVSLVICVVSNFINILLNQLKISLVTNNLKRIILFFALSFNIALTVYYWLLALCRVDCVTYEYAKKVVRRHRC